MDPMEQLRQAQPMPRGERLATWWRRIGEPQWPSDWCDMRYQAMHMGHSGDGRWWFMAAEAALPFMPAAIRAHAAPLALARERRRRERAEAEANAWSVRWQKAVMDVSRLREFGHKVEAIMDSICGAQVFNWSEHAYPLRAALEAAGFPGSGYEAARKGVGTLLERIAHLESEVARLQPPTREEVERAVDALEGALAWASLEPDDDVAASDDRCTRARDALVALATTRERT